MALHIARCHDTVIFQRCVQNGSARSSNSGLVGGLQLAVLEKHVAILFFSLRAIKNPQHLVFHKINFDDINSASLLFGLVTFFSRHKGLSV